MADHERKRLHAHETTILNYGHFGTSTYDDGIHAWQFLRSSTAEGAAVPNSDTLNKLDSNNLPIRIIDGPTEVVKSMQRQNQKPSIRNTPRSLRDVVGSEPLTGPAFAILKEDHSNATGKDDGPQALQSTQLAFGSALWLGEDDVQSGQLSVPIAAHVIGYRQGAVRLVCLGRQSVSVNPTHSTTSIDCEAPSMSGFNSTVWERSSELVKQICFSNKKPDASGDTWLAVRQASATTIFQPLYHRKKQYDGAREDHGRSSPLDANVLLTIDAQSTGGCQHADVSFHPREPNKIAIIDVEGNWSIWNVSGKRKNSARVSYRARLTFTGKLFPWMTTKRPPGVETYYDGWHKITWITAEDSNSHDLLVTNRQTTLLIDSEGNKIGSLDPRLRDHGRNGWILDVVTIQTQPGIVLILTTSCILVFEMSGRDWKIQEQDLSPTLLCAWNHHRGRRDIGLQLCILETFGGEDEIFGPQLQILTESLGVHLVLYSANHPLLAMYHFSINHSRSFVLSTRDPVTIELPFQSRPDIRSLLLRSVELSTTSKLMLVKIFLLQHDFGISEILVHLSNFGKSLHHGLTASQHIPLPSRQLLQQKSTKFVSPEQDEGFVELLSDDSCSSIQYFAKDDEIHHATGDRPAENRSHWDSSASPQKELDFSIVYQHFPTIGFQVPSPNQTVILHYLRQLEVQVELPPAAGDLLAHILPPVPTISDIDEEFQQMESWLNNSDQVTAEGSWLHGFQIRPSTSRFTGSGVAIYDDLVNRFVNHLGSSLHDRIRVQCERISRSITVDVLLSNHRLSPKKYKGTFQARLESPDIRLIASDPITDKDRDNQLSSSQPITEDESISQKDEKNPIHRLAMLTSITRPLADTHNPAGIDGVLYHLPLSIDEDPATYDFRSKETELALAKAETNNHDLDPRSKRRAEKLAQARQNNFDKQQQFRKIAALRNTEIPNVESSQARLLPIREIQSSQTRAPAASSSQGIEQAFEPGFSMTQPERGAFGARSPRKRKRKATKPRREGF